MRHIDYLQLWSDIIGVGGVMTASKYVGRVSLCFDPQKCFV